MGGKFGEKLSGAELWFFCEAQPNILVLNIAQNIFKKLEVIVLPIPFYLSSLLGRDYITSLACAAQENRGIFLRQSVG